MSVQDHELHECPQCGSSKVDIKVDIKRSPLLQKEFVNRKAGRTVGAIASLIAAPFTLGLSSVAFGAYLITDGAARALTSGGRNAQVTAEARRCAVMTCRICRREWLAEDWNDIRGLHGAQRAIARDVTPGDAKLRRGASSQASPSERRASPQASPSERRRHRESDFTETELRGD